MKLFSHVLAALSATAALMAANSAEAHFIWLVPHVENGQATVQVYFAEDASPDDPEYLNRLKGMTVRQVARQAEPIALNLVHADDALSATPVGNPGQAVFIASHDWGVLDRGDSVFRLTYYAKTGPAVTSDVWSHTDCSDDLRLDIAPQLEGGRLTVTVRFDGRPLEGAQVVASGPGMEGFEGTTTADGKASFALAKPGLYSIRARHIENAAGELDGKTYQEVRHYTTVAVEIPGGSPASSVAARTALPLPPLPEAVTSFGAAICGGYLYVYGGHTGSAHSYSTAEQGNQLRRVSLQGGDWETVAEGPHLQGLSLVAHGGKLYRIGGFTAKNAEGEEHDLWSQDDVAGFDPETGEWSDLPPLPEPRSSHDAAVVGDTVYVVGGWTMAGAAEHLWHETAWAMNLSQEPLEWKPLPTAPFRRRALAAAAHDGKVYVIGGMQPEGGPTTEVAVFDPRANTWSEGPPLVTVKAEPGEDSGRGSADGGQHRVPGGMTGFGAAAFATGGRLYVSTIDGHLQRLTADGTAWEIVSQTPTARFFHRLLPLDEHRLLVVGGANMGVGKFEELEVLDVK